MTGEKCSTVEAFGPKDPEGKILYIEGWKLLAHTQPCFMLAMMSGAGRVVGIGSWKIFLNRFVDNPQLGNKQLFENCIRWLLLQQESPPAGLPVRCPGRGINHQRIRDMAYAGLHPGRLQVERVEGGCSPHPRNQPISDSLCVLLIARQLVPQGSVLKYRSHDQERAQQDARDQSPQGTQAKGHADEDQEARHVPRMSDEGIRTGSMTLCPRSVWMRTVGSKNLFTDSAHVRPTIPVIRRA